MLTLEFKLRGGEELIKDGVATKKTAKQLHETQGFNNVHGHGACVLEVKKQWYWKCPAGFCFAVIRNDGLERASSQAAKDEDVRKLNTWINLTQQHQLGLQ